MVFFFASGLLLEMRGRIFFGQGRRKGEIELYFEVLFTSNITCETIVQLTISTKNCLLQVTTCETILWISSYSL